MIKTRYRLVKKLPDIFGNRFFASVAAMEPLSTLQTIQLPWKKAVGFSVHDFSGNKYIDLTSGIFVANAGHANKGVKAAIKKVLDSDLLFAYNYPTTVKRAFLKKLLAVSPRHFDRVLLLMSGSETVDAAYKLIRNWGGRRGRKCIVAFNGSYHGRGLSNDMICGSKDKAGWSGVRDKNVVFLDFPYSSDARFDPAKLPPPGEIAGFMLETFQGWGAWFYPPAYIMALYAFAKKAGALVCFDEMQSGFYRLGPVYGYLTYSPGIKPDILCLGKGISSSLPLAAVLTRREIADADPKADLHGTQSGNPLCCAASLANLEFLGSRKMRDHLKKVMPLWEKETAALAGLPGVTQVNTRGLIAGIIFETTAGATQAVKRCIYAGVLPVCTNRNSIKLAPPLCITAAALKEALAVVREAIKGPGKHG